jgi:hypothetical protein
METSKKHGGAREGGGRPPIKDGEQSIPVMIRMTESQKEKLKRLGGPPWVRDRIDKAKEPKE